jgi:hypothetical protein
MLHAIAYQERIVPNAPPSQRRQPSRSGSVSVRGRVERRRAPSLRPPAARPRAGKAIPRDLLLTLLA